MARATFSLTSRPWVREITWSAMSMPAETPEEVTNFPSSTQRATLTQVTRGPWSATHWKKALLVVARRPSRRPARARSAAPVQTEVTISASAARCASQSSSGRFSTSSRVPMPPGTRSRSRCGQSARPWSATARTRSALATGPARSATVTTRKSPPRPPNASSGPNTSSSSKPGKSTTPSVRSAMSASGSECPLQGPHPARDRGGFQDDRFDDRLTEVGRAPAREASHRGYHLPRALEQRPRAGRPRGSRVGDQPLRPAELRGELVGGLRRPAGRGGGRREGRGEVLVQGARDEVEPGQLGRAAPGGGVARVHGARVAVVAHERSPGAAAGARVAALRPVADVVVVAHHGGMCAHAAVAGVLGAGVAVVALRVRGAHQRGGGEGVEAAGAGRLVEARRPDVDRTAAERVLDMGRRQGGVLREEERRDGGRVRRGRRGAAEGAGRRTGGEAAGVADADAVEAGEVGLGTGRGRREEDLR